MKIQMQEGANEGQLTFTSWNVAIAGTPLDDRGQRAIEFLTRNTERVVTVEYDAEEFTVTVDGRELSADEIEVSLKELQSQSVILEITTLGFVEVFQCCRALRRLGTQKLSFLYVEPFRYTLRTSNPQRSQLLDKRDFELSEEVPGYKAIPGATLMLSDRLVQRVVFFLGYEEQRLERALEDYQSIQPSSCSVVFGVPAFKPGWEMDSFANNIRVIADRNIHGGVYFCGAESPEGAVDVLLQISSELTQNERLFIGPIGTKPHGLAAALFACIKPNIGILYDHPKRRQGRTSQVSRWHLYEVEFE